MTITCKLHTRPHSGARKEVCDNTGKGMGRNLTRVRRRRPLRGTRLSCESGFSISQVQMLTQALAHANVHDQVTPPDVYCTRTGVSCETD